MRTTIFGYSKNAYFRARAAAMALLLMSLPAAAAGASALPAGHAHAGHSEAWQGAAVGGFHADEGRDGHGSLSVYGRSPVAAPTSLTSPVRPAPADVPLPGDIDAVPADTINGRPVYHSVFYKLHPQQIWRGEEGEVSSNDIFYPLETKRISVNGQRINKTNPFKDKGMFAFLNSLMAPGTRHIFHHRATLGDGVNLRFQLFGLDSLRYADGTLAEVRFVPLASETRVYTSNGKKCPSTGHKSYHKTCLELVCRDVRAMEFSAYAASVVGKDGEPIDMTDSKNGNNWTFTNPASGINIEVKDIDCAADHSYVRAQIGFSWMGQLSQVASVFAPNNDEVRFLYLVLDKNKFFAEYQKYLRAHLYDDDAMRQAKYHALRLSISDVGKRTLGARIRGYSLYEENPEYAIDDNHYFLSDNKDPATGVEYFYRDGPMDSVLFFDTSVKKDLTRGSVKGDIYFKVPPGKQYIVCMAPFSPDSVITGDLLQIASDQLLAHAMTDRIFFVPRQTLIRANGELIDEGVDYCAGVTRYVSAQVRVPRDKDGHRTYEVINQGVFYDWFLGDQMVFSVTDNRFGGVSLQQALLDFRAVYPDATELSAKATPWSDGELTTPAGDMATFTRDEFDIINHYLNQPRDEGGMSQLVLRRRGLDVTLRLGVNKFVVAPIHKPNPPSGSPISVADWDRVCWNPVPFSITTDGNAPSLQPGSELVEYPYPDFNPALRINLSQLKQAQGNRLRVMVRNAGIGGKPAPVRIDPVPTTWGEYAYLVGTDDPQYDEEFTNENLTEQDIPAAKLLNLNGNSIAADPASSFMELQPMPTPGGKSLREGYTYIYYVPLSVTRNNTGKRATCDGSMTLHVKVVPEYLVWQGGPDDNWNNDALWRRADPADLMAPADGYTTNAANGTSAGFVPTCYSSVVMPAGSKSSLYMPDYAGGGDRGAADGRPDSYGPATRYIGYDMVGYGTGPGLANVTADPDFSHGGKNASAASVIGGRFRANVCDKIHFATGARMLHAEQLGYSKASMDVELPSKAWTLVSTPLLSVYSGDWYTSLGGSQADVRYFSDLTFDASRNSRLQPAVYQRSWDNAARIIEQGGGTTPASFAAGWSSAYNDASVAYVPGQGYSLKATAVGGAAGRLSFRMPKADAAYSVPNAKLQRNGAGRLFVSGLLDRADGQAHSPKPYVEAGLTASQDGLYLLVGNPFMAELDLPRFFEANDNLEKAYWTATADGPVAGGAATDGSGWTTPGATSTIPPFGAFFVKKVAAEASSTVRFAPAMQAFADGAATSPAPAPVLTVAASAGGRRSAAAIVPAAGAAAEAPAGAGVGLLAPFGAADADVPLVYTVGCSDALVVNRVGGSRRIPLGVFAESGQRVALTFHGVDAFEGARLYDAATRTETRLADGYTIAVDGPSHGRYYILVDRPSATGIDEAAAAANLSAYSMSAGEIIVAASQPIGRVRVYSPSGSLLATADASGRGECRIAGLARGLAVVSVELPGGRESRKVIVR